VASRARHRLGLQRVTLDDESLDRIEELADLEAIRETLKDALRLLSPKVADAVLLRIGAELPYEEVARRLGCSVGAARVRVARGLRQLSDQLGGS
jgi:RNA polymerase sigma factor (sigma-70 family)